MLQNLLLVGCCNSEIFQLWHQQQLSILDLSKQPLVEEVEAAVQIVHPMQLFYHTGFIDACMN